MKQVTAKVISNEKILGGIQHRSGRYISCVKLIELRYPELALKAKPGQFVMVSCDKECVLPRPLSIHQANEECIAIYYNVWAGSKGTEWLAWHQHGDDIDIIDEPLGNGYSIHPESRRLLLLAGGIGIASLRFLVDEGVKKGLTVTLLRGTPTGDHCYPDSLLPPEVKLVSVTEDGSVGTKGFVTDLLPKYAPDADQIFACGPVGMYCAMAKMSETIPELKSAQISLEMRMGCGRGICYACTIRTRQGLKQVCKDGPVFELDDIIWDELTSI